MPLGVAPDLSRDALIVSAANRDALAFLEAWPRWPGRTAILFGPPGAGKTHLAAVWRTHVAATAAGDPADILDDLGAGGALDEAALFHRINLADETGGWLLLVGQAPPEAWPVTLPDLSSRLRRAVSVGIGEVDDTLVEQLLVKLFADRQIEVSADLVRYLATRMDRSAAAARRLVAEIDRTALARKGPISRAIARDVIERFAAGGDDADEERRYNLDINLP